MKQDTRGQAFTLEGVAAAVLLLGSLVFALQVAAVTPNSGSTANPNVGTQQAWVASGLLADASADGTLKRSVLYWDESDQSFHGAEEYGYYVDAMPTTFGKVVEDTIYERGYAYNLGIAYLTTDDQIRHVPVVNRGTPSDDAVRVVEYITLYDADTLYLDGEVDGIGSGSALVDAEGDFYAPNRDGAVYNVLRVEVTIWRV